MSIAECLRELVAKKMGVAQKAAKGKARDDARGQRIVPDYALVHTAAHEEVIVKEAQRFVAVQRVLERRPLTD